MQPKTVALTGLYLAAIIIANLTVAWFGATVVLINSFFLVALDLVARDALHELWQGRIQPMAVLIATGSILSAVLSIAALPVAVASFAAFALSGLADTLVYGRLRERGWFFKVNGSNVVSALVDSAVFLSLLAALGGLPWSLVPVLVLGQWAAKVAGGVAWSYLLRPRQATAVRTP